jgi:hypothetical protein
LPGLFLCADALKREGQPMGGIIWSLLQYLPRCTTLNQKEGEAAVAAVAVAADSVFIILFLLEFWASSRRSREIIAPR